MCAGHILKFQENLQHPHSPAATHAIALAKVTLDYFSHLGFFVCISNGRRYQIQLESAYQMSESESLPLFRMDR